ncbi:hypothetical protein LTR36_005786 [Oleoguttula mirabilis]|uniref:SET domain-containing protein n=1 Tax=Oleoguttula mirabilis TaxID=1507867 RepID=A0AAV9JE03_9PEZI|nr:hypothetical protein LTR36_005786 [Oleoguttula mirabilis]
MATLARLWYVEKTATRGSALVARRNIDRGDLILEEPPLLKLPPVPEDMIDHDRFLTANQPHNGSATVEAAILKMSDSQKADMMKLQRQPGNDRANHGRNERANHGRNDVSIVATNAFTHHIKDENGFDVGMPCVYNNISRTNHSCEPNAVVSWHPRKQRGTLHAIAQIPAKTEITVDYMADEKSCLRSSAQRNVDLQLHYGFTCTCTACHLNGAVNAPNDALRATALQEFNAPIYFVIDTVLGHPLASDEATRRTQMGHLDRYIDALNQLGLKDWKVAEAYEARAKLHEQGLSICKARLRQATVQGRAPTVNDHALWAAEDWRRAMWTNMRCSGEEHESVDIDSANVVRLQLVAAKLRSPTIPQGFP